MVAAAVGAAATVASAASSMSASGDQQSAASSASDSQMAMYQQMRSDLLPYMQTGMAANKSLNDLTGVGGADPLSSPLLKPITMDQATLEKTPGYQFNLQQGLKSVQNSAAARGLGVSGAAQKGAANYATGLADSTYQNQFSNALTNQQNQLKNLMGITQLGQTSAAGVGSAGVTTGQGIASNTIGGGNAAAAGALGVGNALSSAYPNYVANKALTGLYGNSGGGGSAPDGNSLAAYTDSSGINWNSWGA